LDLKEGKDMEDKKPETKCCVCQLPIEDKEEQEWAKNQENHPGVLGTPHRKCYDKVCKEDPDTPWTDPISGEVDYETMAEDLGVETGEEEWDEGAEFY